MIEYNIDDVKVKAEDMISKKEAEFYVDYIKRNHVGQILESLELTIDGDEIIAVSSFKPVQFEKIRRITGYLVGTVDRFNDGKKAEEKDRVKHI